MMQVFWFLPSASNLRDMTSSIANHSINVWWTLGFRPFGFHRVFGYAVRQQKWEQLGLQNALLLVTTGIYGRDSFYHL